MHKKGEIREERRQIKGRRGEVEMSSQGNEGDRMVIARRPRWSILVLTSRLFFFFFFFFGPIYIPEYKPETKPGRSYEPLHLETKVNYRWPTEPTGSSERR
jgi:hypothetical protein